MTLRTRLVLALLALTTVGLTVFGVSTYTLYKRSLERQLDEDLRASARGQGARLVVTSSDFQIDPETCLPVGSTTSIATPPEFGDGGAPGQGLDAYSELRDTIGSIVACSLPVTTDGRPDLPDEVDTGDVGEAFLDVGSATGSGSWRVLALDASELPLGGPTFNGSPSATVDGQVLVAVRTDGIDQSLQRLARIELGAAVVLLSVLGAGAWLVLRRGLRPLEEMADSAATITAGDLTRRVEPADDHTEVGQLGLALNTMLDGIEESFREREATEARLRQFLADASHELRTPLTSIQGFAELFRLADQGEPGDLERLDLPVMLARIEQESGRMKALVEDLLLLARLDEPRALEPEPVDLAVVAAEACTSAAALQPARRITLEAPDAVTVVGVADHLHRALTNLIANAIKHTPETSPIDVTVTGDDGRATVTVRDHGPGLDDEALAHVFDRFWQADSARVGVGSGLGLSIVAGIAAEHGGTARAANAPSGGAIFALELPVSPTR